MFRPITIAAIASLWVTAVVQAQSERPAADAQRMAIGRTGGGDGGGSILSEHISKDGNTLQHGLQVTFGPKLQIKEYSVYNLGRCEQLWQFYENGSEFRVQWRDHEGNGSEAIYAPTAAKVVADKVIVADGTDIGPVKVPEIICTGRVKGGKCWDGSFLVRELHDFQMDWMLQEYKDGERINNKPFPLEKLGIKPPPDRLANHDWRWTIPDWPKPAK